MKTATGEVHSAPAPSAPKRRLAALDQFRGYTVAGMFLVDFIGGYAAVHPVFGHHNTYCSYADTIMPGFFFAVGFAFRLTFLQRVREAGTASAHRHAIWRNLKLLLIGFLAYNVGNLPHLRETLGTGQTGAYLVQILTVDTFQALVHIAVTSLWLLPVIGLAPRWRWLALAASVPLHYASLHVFYYDWAHGHVIDGGPLGFVGWAIPTLAGSLACDAVRDDRAPLAQWKRMGGWAAALMLAGYALACLNVWVGAGAGQGRWFVEPPFVQPALPVDIWTMMQQTASPSYMLFSAGFSILVYLLFVLVSDAWQVQVGIFRTLGKNALFAYLLHGFVGAYMEPTISNESTLSTILLTFVAFFFINWAVLRVMEYKEWYWKL